MFWIITPDPRRGYGVTYTTPRDQSVFTEIKRESDLFASLVDAWPSMQLRKTNQHLVPHQFAFRRTASEAGTVPQAAGRENNALLFQFKPGMATAQRFEKIGSGPGYIWGSGAGFIEYVVPARHNYRRVGRILVRDHPQPVLPIDAK